MIYSGTEKGLLRGYTVPAEATLDTEILGVDGTVEALLA